MNNWGANHGAISYGHIGQDLITLASILRIPVCMHNVDENEIFRPAAWNASVWIKREPTTGPARTTVLSTNNAVKRDFTNVKTLLKINYDYRRTYRTVYCTGTPGR